MIQEVQIFEFENLNYSTEMKSLILKNNKFIQNFASSGSFGTKIHGFPIVILDQEYYKDNGDNFVEAFKKFSPIFKYSPSQNENSLENMIANSSLQNSNLKSKSLIGIIGGGQAIINNCEFVSNWHKEFPKDLQISSLSYSQLIQFKYHSAEVVKFLILF